MEQEKKYYQVFSVDVCFDAWSMNYIMVGGESVDDVASHLKEVYSLIDKHGKRRYYDQNKVKRVVKEKATRIKPIQDVFTTTPYKILDQYAYYE